MKDESAPREKNIFVDDSFDFSDGKLYKLNCLFMYVIGENNHSMSQLVNKWLEVKMKNKLIESKDFKLAKFSIKESLVLMVDLSRNSTPVEWAKKIAKSFECKFNKNLVYTKIGERETPRFPLKPRVEVCSLAEDICKQLNIKPDESLMDFANHTNSTGMRYEYKTKSCVKALAEHFKIAVELEL